MGRRLLVEGQYGRAWRFVSLPSEPHISATGLEAAVGDTTR